MGKSNELFEDIREAVAKAVAARGLMDIQSIVLEEEPDPQMQALLLVFDGIMMSAKEKLGAEALNEALDEAFEAFTTDIRKAADTTAETLAKRWRA